MEFTFGGANIGNRVSLLMNDVVWKDEVESIGGPRVRTGECGIMEK